MDRMEMKHRQPTASDVGKTVEFSIDGEQWHTAKLSSIDYDEVGPLFWQNIEGKHRFFNHCRVPYSCPDPIAELSILADELAAAGHDEAARVLMLWLSLSDIDKRRLAMYESGDSLTVWDTKLNEHERPSTLRQRMPEPEPNHIR